VCLFSTTYKPAKPSVCSILFQFQIRLVEARQRTNVHLPFSGAAVRWHTINMFGVPVSSSSSKVALILLAAPAAFAQLSGGSISGTISDPSGGLRLPRTEWGSSGFLPSSAPSGSVRALDSLNLDDTGFREQRSRHFHLFSGELLRGLLIACRRFRIR
jgi:hypothetical protein